MKLKGISFRNFAIFILAIMLISSVSGCGLFEKSDQEIPGIQNSGADNSQNSSGSSENTLEIKLRIGSDLMTINGRTMIMDVVPLIKNEITLVPIKFVTEAFNISAYWMPETRQVRIVEGDKEFLLTIDSPKVTIGSQEYTLASPPEIISGRTFVPLRFVSEALGAKVEWDGETRGITITR